MKFLKTEIFFLFLALYSFAMEGSCAENETKEDGKDEDKDPFDIIDKVNREEKEKEEKNGVTGGEKQPDLFEGDIVKTPDLDRRIKGLEFEAKNPDVAADAIRNGEWPNAVVPYTFARGFSEQGRQRVLQAVEEYRRKTCIRFIPRTNERHYVEFFHGSGCYSFIGRLRRGRQQVSLAPGCVRFGIGTAVHEMMHALGFFHEQSRTDRDSFVRVLFENIIAGTESNFRKYRPGSASTLGEPYDKQSVMHYSSRAFSKNGKKTIISLSNPNERLGQRNGLSPIDVRQLNKYYKCSGTVATQRPQTRPPRPRTRPPQPRTTPSIATQRPRTRPPRPRTRPPQPRTTPSTCRDKGPFCLSLRSWCTRSRWVRRNCRDVCGLCGINSCQDRHKNCAYWASQRYCNSNNANARSYMSANCKKSCNLC